MKILKERINYVLNGEDGASNVELIVWFSVVFVLATTLFALRGNITSFLNRIQNQVNGLKVQ